MGTWLNSNSWGQWFHWNFDSVESVWSTEFVLDLSAEKAVMSRTTKGFASHPIKFDFDINQTPRLFILDDSVVDTTGQIRHRHTMRIIIDRETGRMTYGELHTDGSIKNLALGEPFQGEYGICHLGT